MANDITASKLNLEKILAIDPGSRALGWAVFTRGDLECSGVLKESAKNGDWLDRSDRMVDRVLELVSEHQPELVVIEEPQMFLSSSRGMQAMDSGSVLKLISVVMMLRIMIERVGRTPVYLAPVSVWKGQVPKHIMQARLEKRYKISIADNNESDAIGLADWYIRVKR